MKQLISLALIVSCIFTFSNCSQNEVDKIKPYFNFTEDTNTSPEFTADGGTTLVSFETSHNWTASSNQNWITLSSKSGTPSKTNFTITVSENKSTSLRDGVIEIKSNNDSYTIFVSQKGKEDEPIFTLSPSSSTVSADGGNISLTLKYDVDEDYIQYGVFDKNNNPIDWIELIETRTNTLELIFSISKNTSSSERVGIIVLYDLKNDKEQNAIITQRGVETVFEFINNTDTSPEFNAQGGTSQVSFKTSHDWIANSNQNWISLSRTSGTSSNANFTISVGENTSSSQRTGVVTITSNNKSYKINVSQKGVSEPIISFEDSLTKSICVNNWDTNKDGEISYTEAEKVTKISADIFKGTSIVSFRELKFFKNIKEIHSNAFNGCSSLTSIELPEGVTSMGDYVFYNCISLSSVVIPTCWIGDYTFCNCSSLTDVSIGNSVTIIGEGAFVGCKSLRTITVPDGVTTIEQFAFQDCTSLSTISIGESVAEIGARAFSGCTGTLEIYGKVIEIDYRLDEPEDPDYWLYNSYFSTIIIDGVATKIGNNTFNNYSSITSVYIGSSVKSIGNNAFYSCENITDISIGNNVTSIGHSAFAWCSSLEKVTIPNSVISIGDGAFVDCKFLSSLKLGNNLQTIGEYAFRNCAFGKITISSSVMSIGSEAFYGCSNLNRVDISDLSAWCKIEFGDRTANPLHAKDHWYESTGARLYLDNKEVTYITIPSDITEIKDYAFTGCISPSMAEIHEDVTYIGCGAFHDCTSLNVVKCYPKTPPTLGDTRVFSHSYKYINHEIEIWVWTSSISQYRDEWSEYKSVIVGYL